MNLAHIIFFLHALRPLQYTILQALHPIFARQVTSVGTVSALSTSSLFLSCWKRRPLPMIYFLWLFRRGILA